MVSHESSRRPHSAKRLGDDYQDIVGIDQLLRLLRHPHEAQWIVLEADDAGALDDVVVQCDDHIEYLQVKYAVEPEQRWSIDDLVASPTPTTASLLRKWARSWEAISRQATPFLVRILTNRLPDADLMALLTADRRSVNPALVDRSRPREGVRRLLDATGLGSSDARSFLRSLTFAFGLPMLDALTARVRRDFEDLGTSADGWNSLLLECRRWTRYREPPPDGRIRAGDVRIAARLWDPRTRELSQHFPQDAVITIPNEALINRLRPSPEVAKQGTYTLLSGLPGAGKSSFLSRFADHLETDSVVETVIRHHCFVGMDDQQGSRRLRSDVAATDIFRQLYAHFSEDLSAAPNFRHLHLESPTLHNLEDWLRVCAQASMSRDKCLLLVLDGLDHVYDERGGDELRLLLNELPVPAPPGLCCVLGSQPRNQLLPDRLTRALVANVPCEGFDRDAIRQYATAYLRTPPSKDLLDTLDDLSSGNPLYLHYVLTQARLSDDVDELWFRQLPEYGGSITAYYDRLWTHVSNASRSLAVALAEASFPIPDAETILLMQSLGHSATEAAVARKSIEHLVHTELGASRLYHTSFRAFVSSHRDALLLRPTVTSALLHWIVTRGGTYLKWRYEWEYSLRLGNHHPLLDGTDRSWVVSSLAQLLPPHEIAELLTLAIDTALDNADLSTAFSRSALLAQLRDVTDGSATGLTHLRAARTRLGGAGPVAQSAIEHEHWDTDSLLLLSRLSRQTGAASIADQVLQIIQDRVSGINRLQLDDLESLYRAADALR